MSDVAIIIRLYCYESDYHYKIYLYYDSRELAEKNFWNPITMSLKDTNFSGVISSVEAPKGVIEVGRHFIKDYKENRRYKIEVNNIVINYVEFIYEDDMSESLRYDDIAIKNVNIKFKNSECYEKSVDEN